MAKGSDNIEILEETFRNWMAKDVFSPEEIMAAMHNACAHGQVINDNGNYVVNDKQLGKLFDGFDQCLKALKKMSA